MSDDSIYNPHDKLAKVTFSDLPTASAFLRESLPPDLAARMDWSTLRLESGSFINPEFAASESDLLYSISLNQTPTLLYILFEHQSTDDPWIAFRLLSYMVRIWDQSLRASPKPSKLPPIIPILLAQSDKPWKAPVRFADLVEQPAGMAAALAPHIPDFIHRLVELYRIPLEEMPGTPWGILTLRALKAERLGDLLDDLVWDEALLLQIPPFALEMLLRYILRADIDKDQFTSKLKNITNPKIQSTAMTLEQQFRQEGRQEEQIYSKRQSVIENLEARFEQVPAGLIEVIESINDLQKLTFLHRTAATCPDLEAFAATL